MEYTYCLDVTDLLRRSIMSYDGIKLKFKRTHPTIDRQCFVLLATINEHPTAINMTKFVAYIDILVNQREREITDCSSATQCILHVQCNDVIGTTLVVLPIRYRSIFVRFSFD
jgi:tRNA(Phe) wybutosine-synthesizing methylase Tyw3